MTTRTAPRRLSELMNLGPVTERMLPEVDIHDEDELRAVGAREAWRRLKFRFPRHINVMALYALEGAVRGCHWNELPPDVKAELQAFAREVGGSVSRRAGRERREG